MLRSGIAVLVFLGSVSGVGMRIGDWSLPISEPAEARQSSSAFGFDIGEERRYVLGPPEALDPGERATWLMRLDRIRDSGEAVFYLEHHRTGPDSTTGTPAWGEELAAGMDGELTVNEHGFPVHLEFTAYRSAYGYIDDHYYVRYEFDGVDWDKHANTFGKDWDIDLPIQGHRNLDKDVPIGMYLFLPDAFHCLGYRPSMARIQSPGPQRATAGSPASPAGGGPSVERYARTCEPDTDLGFLNPGLLSLAWPALIEEPSLDQQFLFFTPTGAVLFPGPATSVSIGGAGSGGASQRDGGLERARDMSRLYANSRIDLGASAEIRVRGRRMDAIAAEIRGLVGTVYFDDEGKALFVEIDSSRLIDADIYAGNVFNGALVNVNPDELERRHIRLMFPSEY